MTGDGCTDPCFRGANGGPARAASSNLGDLGRVGKVYRAPGIATLSSAHNMGKKPLPIIEPEGFVLDPMRDLFLFMGPYKLVFYLSLIHI